MLLSIIVPATDDPPTLDRCLAAIAAVAGPSDEVLVQRQGPRISAGDARNAAVARASGELLVFVDADVLVHKDAIERMKGHMQADPGLDAVFGSYDDRPHHPGLVSRFRNLLHHHVHQGAPGASASFWSGLGCVRASSFHDAGGFEPRRRWLEDVELGHRITLGGGRIRLDPQVMGTHLKRWSLAEMVRTDVWRRGRPWVELLLARRSNQLALSVGWRHRFSALAAILILSAVAMLELLLVLAACAALVLLNLSFYRLLLGRGGPLLAAAGFGLHILHLLAAVVSLPIGALTYVLALRRRHRAGETSVQLPRTDP